MELIAYLFVFFFLAIFLKQSIFIAHEKQRILISNMGKFIRLAGPGLVIKNPFLNHHYSRLTVGDSGKCLTKGSAEFNEVDLPISQSGNVLPGEPVVVANFDFEQRVVVEKDTRAMRHFKCEQCGHENELVG